MRRRKYHTLTDVEPENNKRGLIDILHRFTSETVLVGIKIDNELYKASAKRLAARHSMQMVPLQTSRIRGWVIAKVIFWQPAFHMCTV